MPQVNPAQHAHGMLKDYGCHVFTPREMKERIPKQAFDLLQKCAAGQTELDRPTADVVASVLKDWALERGALTFSHWFHPLRQNPGQKQIYFLQMIPDSSVGTPLVAMKGKQLLQGETDGSSYPNGGLRVTNSARAYSAWDPSSPPFILHGCLFIPAVFSTMFGQALDVKLSLLRSERAISAAAARVVQILQRALPRKTPIEVKELHTRAGLEQEMFIIDKELFNRRPDLVLCGRTVLGALPPNHQQLDNHYWGIMPGRVRDALKAVAARLWQLGIPVQQIHNEVAPTQFEMVPDHSPSVVACDQNVLMMQVMQEICTDHGLACLFHEKPFANMNGSGKHVNWSLCTGSECLLEEGDNPGQNPYFMVFLAAFIRACDIHWDLLRASIACPGNDFRLGGMEAPPGIVTVFTGHELEKVIDQIISGRPVQPPGQTIMDLGVTGLPRIKRDLGDRNRSSPMAFTGNRWEFRAVGSTQNAAIPLTVINTIVAESLNEMCDKMEELMNKGAQCQVAVQEVIKSELKQHRRIIYNGNCYASEYREECQRRGLLNIDDGAKALALWNNPKNSALFEKLKVLTPEEFKAHAVAHAKNYSKTLSIDARCCLEMAQNMVLPAAVRLQKTYAESADVTGRVLGSGKLTSQRENLALLTGEVNGLLQANSHLRKVLEACSKIPTGLKQAFFQQKNVIPSMANVRAICDRLEGIVEARGWPFPPYKEILWQRLGSL